MNRKVVISSLFWRFAERCGAQGVSFIVGLVLARLLAPEDYGLIAIVSVFTTFLDIFIDSGMGGALVQKKNADDLDYSSVFYFNVIFSVVIYTAFFFLSPLLASLYDAPKLVPVFRVMGITFLISGVKNVQLAYVQSSMAFKKFFYANLGGSILSAIIGITFAYLGYGVWALAAQSLTSNLFGAVVLWVTVKWRPKWIFSFKSLKGLLSYGGKMLIACLISNAYSDIWQLFISFIYTPTDLAFYNKGNHFPNLIIKNINTSIDSVLLPAMSKVQDEMERLKAMTRRSIKTSTYIMAPLLLGLAICGEPMIKLLLTEKWLPCVPFMQIFCIVYLLYPLTTANVNAIMAVGRSDLVLKLEIAKSVFGLVALLVTMKFGVIAIAFGFLATNLFTQFIKAFPNKKLMGYSYFEQLKDILPSIALATAMAVIVGLVLLLKLSPLVTLLIQVPLGAVIYIAGSWIFKLDSFTYILSILKDFTKKKKA